LPGEIENLLVALVNGNGSSYGRMCGPRRYESMISGQQSGYLHRISSHDKE
jgi:hypothetical protein